MVASLMFVLVGCLAQASPQKASANPAAFGRAVIDVLAYTATARDIINTPERKGKGRLESSLNEMVRTRQAIARFRDGMTAIEPFADGSETTMNSAAEVFQVVLRTLVSGMEDHLAIQEQLLKAKTEDDVAALLPKASELAATVDEAWRLLPKVIILASGALVDENRQVDGKLRYLRITVEQRLDLITSVTKAFPNLKPGGGHAVDVAASLFLQWLKGGWKGSDE
jgi:hypothetical protein